MIKLGLIEDDLNFRRNLIKFLNFSPEFEICFEEGTAETGIEQLKKNKDTDILILDIGLPGMSGLDSIPHLKQIKPELEIIIFTAFEDEDKILKALCAGATSYLSKKSTLEEISTAIKIVQNGGAYMSPSIAREIVHYFINGKVKKPVIKLSNRQKEIMDLMIEGKTYNSIAEELYIAIDTVRYHIKSLYKTLHASNKAEAIANYLKGSF